MYNFILLTIFITLLPFYPCCSLDFGNSSLNLKADNLFSKKFIDYSINFKNNLTEGHMNNSEYDFDHYNFYSYRSLMSLYFHLDYGQTSINENFWEELLNPYNLPSSKIINKNFLLGVICATGRLYFDVKFELFGSKYNEENDSLKSNIRNGIYCLDIGYNLINNPILSVSPYLGFHIFFGTIDISSKNDNLTLEQWLKKPDINLNIENPLGVVGINFIIRIFENWMIHFNPGYNIFYSKIPDIKSNKSTIKNPGIPFLKGFFFSIGLGFGGYEKFRPFHLDEPPGVD
ncbi:MAG: hypothetical protein HW421_1266 [Ignavibacteria bacterium]|nr:hypothetical protein [Ignavibacteria bacterium]